MPTDQDHTHEALLEVMLDLETMSTSTTAAIISIGAVAFDRDAGQLAGRPMFHQPVTLQSCIDAGLQVDGDTIAWWLRQSADARQSVQGGIDLKAALQGFHTWLEQCGPLDQLRIWGNGAAFDNPILSNAYKRCGLPVPWRYWNDRCYRTLAAEWPEVAFVTYGTEHNALDDACAQALHLLRIDKARRADAQPNTQHPGE